jgi:hypothetical protein
MRDYNYPVYFGNKTCVACGSNTLVPIDKMDNINTNPKPFYPIYKMRCRRCGREYFINWTSSTDNGAIDLSVPIAVSKNCIDEFIDFIEEELNKLN